MQTKMPPILLAAMALDLGGAETHVISLARELRRRGHDVVVASAGGRMVPMLSQVGVPHEKVPMDSRSPAEMLRAYWRLRQIVRDYQIGLVHAHARIPAWLSSLVIARRPVPFVTTYHGTYNAGFPWKYLTTFGQRTIAVSEDVQRHLEGPLGAPSEQIRVVPNGINIGEFRPGIDVAPLFEEFVVRTAGPHIVQAGRQDGPFADAVVTLLQSLPEVAHHYPNVQLWILGDGDRGEEIRRKVAETNRLLRREAVVATGVRLDVARFFSLADCVVAVARTATEAMACARPVIIAGEGGYRGIMMPEQMEEFAVANFTAREGGRPLDQYEMAADLVKLLRPTVAAERARIGAAGRSYVVDHFSIEAIATRILEVYAEVL